MSKFIGRLVDIGVARETSRGTYVAPTFWLPHVAFSFDDKITQARSDAGLSRIEDSEEAFVISNYSQGDFEGEIRDKSFGLILYSLLGSVSTSGPTDSAYTHAFSLSNTNSHTSLSLTVHDPNTSEFYKLVMLDSLEIKAELDEIVKFTASFMGKKGGGTTSASSAYVAENKFTKKHVQLRVASTIGGLSGAAVVSLKSLSVTFNKNVILDEVLGTAEPEDILNRQLSIEGELTLNYEDATWKQYMTTPTNRAMEIKFVNTDAIIGASTNPSLTMQFPKVDFFDWEPDYSNDDISTQKISFKASRDVANSLASISTCSLVNANSSY